jgi:hypothetical protein
MLPMPTMNLGVVRLRHFTQLRGLVWRWPHFSPAELADMETGEVVVVPVFLDWLEEVRTEHDRPIIVTDASRTKDRQFRLTGRYTGAHPDGMALDAGCHGEDAERLERIAIGKGVLGRGVQQSGALPLRKRYLHLDNWTKAPPGLRPRLWSY